MAADGLQDLAWHIWRAAPHLVSTDPSDGGKVYTPLNVILVTFDKDIKPGPNFNNISVTTDMEVRTTYNSVIGNSLQIVFSTIPITLADPEGVVWQVHLFRDAVTNVQGRPMGQDYHWSFTMLMAQYARMQAVQNL